MTSLKQGNNASRLPTKQANADKNANEETAGGSGIRYITEDLLRKVSKQNNLEAITSLNLKLSKEGSKKFRYIENLEKCKKLQILSLSCNAIEKMEKLDKLTRLRELDLSYNCLVKIEGLETLTSLSHLNLNGNKIETIPLWLPKKLKSLQVFKLARNNIHSLHELAKLRPLRDLTHLTVAENPVCALPHCRLFLVFHLCTLDTLDAQHVDWQERTESQARFAQEELENLQKQLDTRETEMQKLQEAHNKSLGEIDEGSKASAAQKDKLKAMNDKIKELQRVLQTKDDLLKRKTKELTNACEKHYELEQELAFYKIDHKFDQLGKPPIPLSTGNSQEDHNIGDFGLIGESPYIGRGWFKKSDNADGTGNLSGSHRQGTTHRHSDREESHIADLETRQKMHEALDKELEDKRKAISRAQDRLHHLSKEVETVEQQLSLATREMKRLQEAQPRPHLTEDDKQVVRSKLTKKISKVHQLRGEADRLESEMEATQGDIHKQEQSISHMRGQLRRMGSHHQLYPAMQREVADKETQLELSNQQYHALVAKLEDVLATIAKETADIQQLEQQLRQGQVTQNEEMREELEGIIGGLQSYLQDVQHKTAQQKQDFDLLLVEREDLQAQLQDLLDENDKLRVTHEHLSQLQDRMASLEESLEDARQENVSLQQQLDESRLRVMEDADMSTQLHDAEQEIHRLTKAVEDAETQLQAEKEAAAERLEAERRQAQQLAARARDASDAEEELRLLHKQLAQLQAANTALQDRLYAAEQKNKQEKQPKIDPEDLKRRLDNVRHAVRTGERSGRSHPNDPINKALHDLQNDLQDELDKSHHDIEQAQQAASKAEQNMARLKRQLDEKQRQLDDEKKRQHEERQRRQMEEERRQKLDKERIKQLEAKQRHLEDMGRSQQEKQRDKRDKQAQIDLEKQEMERMRRELAMLRAALERQRESKENPLPPRLLEPSSRQGTSMASGTRRSSDVFSEVSSSVGSSSEEDLESLPSSQWSARRHQLYDNLTPEEQGLFDELQREMEELRKLLAKKNNKQALHKMTQAEMTANRLMGLMGDRHRRLSGAVSDSAQHSHLKSDVHTSGKQPHRQSYEDPRLKRAAQDLERALDEIETLRNKLKDKNLRLKQEVKHADKVHDKIDGQQEEIDRLHIVLDDQREEIEKLRNKMDQLTRRSQDRTAHKVTAYDAELQELQDSAALLRDTLATHGPRIQRLGATAGYAHSQGTMATDALDGRLHRHGVAETRRHSHPHARNEDGIASEFGPEGFHPYPTSRPPAYPHPVSHAASSIPHVPHAVGQGSGHAQHHPAHYHGPVNQDAGPTHSYPYLHARIHPDVPVASTGPADVATGPVLPPGGQPTVYTAPQNAGFVPYFSGGVPAPPYPVSSTAAVPVPSAMFLPQDYVVPPRPVTPTDRIAQSYSHPTTPVAGSVLGPSAMSLTMTPSTMNSVPVMVSTPMQGNEGVKGILKNGHQDYDLEDELICNVPEHHDLEDYVAKLQAKIKSLKNKLKVKLATKEAESESRRVIFKDDIERRAIKHLQAELQARRGELEGLDLAIERQKSSLRHMKETERFLLSEREAANRELKELQRNKTRDQRRKSFLAGQDDYETYDSDYDYDYVPRRGYSGARVTYLQEEIACLEKTLAKRRAELREADNLLAECDEDLQAARTQTKSAVEKYQEAKTNFTRTVQDAEELERRARETGRELVQAREELNKLTEEVAETQQLHQNQTDMLRQIEQVIMSRDKEFQLVDKQVKETKLRLEEVLLELQQAQKRRLSAESKTSQHSSSKEEQQVSENKVRQHQGELEEVEGLLRKRQGQLDSLDKQLERELSRRRREVQDMQTQSQLMQADHTRLQQQVADRQHELQQVQDEIDREEAVLQDLATTTNKQRSELHTLSTDLQIRQNELRPLNNKLAQKNKDLEALKKNILEEESTLKRTHAERLQQTRDLEEMRLKVTEEKDILKGLTHQRDILEETLDTLRKEKATMEDLQHAVEKKLAQLKRSEGKLEENVKAAGTKLGKLEHEAREMEAEMEGLRNDKSLLHSELHSMKAEIQERKVELDMIINEINEADHQMSLVQQREMERRKMAEEKFSNLEQRVREMGNEIQERTEEKEVLVEALSRSSEELQSLRSNLAMERDQMLQQIRTLEGDVQLLSTQLEDRSKEVKQIRGKCSQEIMDLENIAQAHHSRANRLSDELNYLQAEHLELQRRLKSQKEIEEKERQLEEAIEEMKADIKRELAGSLGELEHSHMESVSELQRMQGQREFLQECLSKLRNNLQMLQIDVKNKEKTVEQEIIPSSDNQFVQQQNYLMAQLKEKVNKHADLLASQKLHSHDNIRKLQLKLTSLERMFAHEDFAPRIHQSDTGVDQPKTSVSPSFLQDSLVNKTASDLLSRLDSPSPSYQPGRTVSPSRAYSPNRHSQQRQRSGADPHIPEKGPS